MAHGDGDQSVGTLGELYARARQCRLGHHGVDPPGFASLRRAQIVPIHEARGHLATTAVARRPVVPG